MVATLIKKVVIIMSNHYANLLMQADKLYRHNRQGSYKTKERYYEAFKRFLRFVAEEYRLEKLQNLSGKHMHSYFVHLKAKGLAASTIKTEASAIRFWHDQIPNAKHTLPSNADLSLERRRYGDKDRTWSDSSYPTARCSSNASAQTGWIMRPAWPSRVISVCGSTRCCGSTRRPPAAP